MTAEIKPGLYRHYSGKQYQVIGVGRHSETLETYVIYQALYDDYDLWIRPLELFNAMVTVNEQTQPRFQFIPSNLTVPPHVKSR